MTKADDDKFDAWGHQLMDLLMLDLASADVEHPEGVPVALSTEDNITWSMRLDFLLYVWVREMLASTDGDVGSVLHAFGVALRGAGLTQVALLKAPLDGAPPTQTH